MNNLFKELLVNKYVIVLFFNTLIAFSQNEIKEQEMVDVFYKGYNYLYTQKDSADHYFKKSLEQAEDLENYEMQLYILNFMIFANGYHYDMKEYRNNLEKYEYVFKKDSMQFKLEEYESYEDNFNLNKGNYYYKLKNYNKAKPYFQELYSKISLKNKNEFKAEEVETLLSIYNFLASIYKNTGKYELSEQYYLKAISFIEDNKGNKNSDKLNLNTNQLLAQLYNLMGNYSKANPLFKKVLKTAKEEYIANKKVKNILLSVYQNTVKNYMDQDSLDLAIKYLDESNNYLIEKDPFKKHTQLLYGDIYSKIFSKEKALKYYNNALQEFKEQHRSKPHQDIAEVYGKISNLCLKEDDYINGLENIKKALNFSTENFKSDTNFENPDPLFVFSKKQLLDLFSIKNQNLFKAYKSTKDFTFLKAALKTNVDILNTFDVLKKEFDSKLDKQFLIEKAYPIFHQMLEITYEAYIIDKSEENIELALKIIEKNKDILLLDAIRSVNATNFGNIPEEILDKEATYSNKINTIEKKIFNNVDQQEYASLNDSLFKLKEEYYTFLDTLSVKYPKYHNLRYEVKDIDFLKLNNAILKKDNVLLSYTLTTNFIYTIVLSEHSQKFIKKPFSEEEKNLVSNFYKLVSRPATLNSNEKVNKMAKTLYNSLCKAALFDVGEKNLIIIPDDILHYLPFELLIDEDDKFMILSKSISYNNSISSLIELNERVVKNNGKLLAFAPSFQESKDVIIDDDKTKFSKLLYNDQEIKKIDAFFDSDIYQNNDATLDNFISNADQFKIIHLATHASANDTYPDYSYLAFSESNANSSTLYIKDLYNTTVNAEMVTLSACQTGIGKLKKGEGMISLSKGFYYAGAKSLIKTLWKTNDKSTSKLMGFFYENLSKGMSKNKALQEAKIKYLETTNDNFLKHPYYWASFVVSGDTSAVKNNKFLLFFTITISIVILIFIFIKKRRLINFIKKVFSSNSFIAI